MLQEILPNILHMFVATMKEVISRKHMFNECCPCNNIKVKLTSIIRMDQKCTISHF